jgi:hypothetical protein
MFMYYCDPTSDLVWAVVPKNMSSTMSNVTDVYNWKRIDNFAHIPKHRHIFCIIQNPWRRFVKGMAENAWITNERSFELVRKMPFYSMSFMNNHLLPISSTYNQALPYMNYVPMDHADRPAIDLLNVLFEKHGSVSRINSQRNRHISSKRKQAYQLEVEDWLVNRYQYRKQVEVFNRTDFINWRAAIVSVDKNEPVDNWLQRSLKRIWTSE